MQLSDVTTICLLGVCMMPGPPVVAATAGGEPWVTESVRMPDRPGGPHVLLIYDMEGLSGQDDVYTWHSTHPVKYAAGRRLLTDDVNAVIDGLFSAGAGAVSVLDCHGGGNLEIDILVDDVDGRADVVTEAPVHCSDFAEPGRVDAVAAVGMHAGSGSGGFSAHTMTLGIEIALNGRRVNETEMLALAYGEAGIPVIFAAGDDVLGEELERMPWMEYVTVKKALGPTRAELFPVDEMHEALAAGAARAVSRIDRAKVAKAVTPVEVTVRAFPPADLTWLEVIPGVKLDDGGISFTEATFAEAAIRTTRIVAAAMYNNYRIVVESAAEHEDWKHDIEARAVERLTPLWYESERARAGAAGSQDR